MAVDANAFKTSSGDAALVNPIIYDEQAIKYMYDREVFRPLGMQDGRMLDRPGKQFNKVLESGWSVSALTEGTATPVSAYDVSGVNVTFAGYGDAKQFTYEELALGFEFMMNNAKYNALGALGINRDNVIVTELMTTATTAKYANNKATGTILAADVFNGDLIVDADEAMFQSQARGLKAVVLHTIQHGALRKDTTRFIDFSKNPITANQILRTGEVGSYQGVAIYRSNRIQSATENTITVYRAIALGNNQPFVFMQKRNPEFKWAEENVRDRAITFHYWEMFGTQIILDDSVMILKSA